MSSSEEQQQQDPSLGKTEGQEDATVSKHTSDNKTEAMDHMIAAHNHRRGNHFGIVPPGMESTGRWTREEHNAFLTGLQEYGKEWKKVAAKVRTRTVVQTRTHAQKYFQKLAKDGAATHVKKGTRLGDVAATFRKTRCSTESASKQASMVGPYGATILSGSTQLADAVSKCRDSSSPTDDLYDLDVDEEEQDMQEEESKPKKLLDLTAGRGGDLTSHQLQEHNTSLPPSNFFEFWTNFNYAIPEQEVGLHNLQAETAIQSNSTSSLKINVPPLTSWKQQPPLPSPAATGKRKYLEVQAAQLLANIFRSEDQEPTPPPSPRTDALNKERAAKKLKKLSIDVPKGSGQTSNSASGAATPFDVEMEGLDIGNTELLAQKLGNLDATSIFPPKAKEDDFLPPGSMDEEFLNALHKKDTDKIDSLLNDTKSQFEFVLIKVAIEYGSSSTFSESDFVLKYVLRLSKYPELANRVTDDKVALHFCTGNPKLFELLFHGTTILFEREDLCRSLVEVCLRKCHHEALSMLLNRISYNGEGASLIGEDINSSEDETYLKQVTQTLSVYLRLCPRSKTLVVAHKECSSISFTENGDECITQPLEDVKRASLETLTLAHSLDYVHHLYKESKDVDGHQNRGRCSVCQLPLSITSDDLRCARRKVGAIIYAVERVLVSRSRNAVVFNSRLDSTQTGGEQEYRKRCNCRGLFHETLNGALHALSHVQCQKVAVLDFTRDALVDSAWPDESVSAIISRQNPKSIFYFGLTPEVRDGAQSPAPANYRSRVEKYNVIKSDELSFIKTYKEIIADRLVPCVRSFDPDLILCTGPLHTMGAWVTRTLAQVADICCQGRFVAIIQESGEMVKYDQDITNEDTINKKIDEHLHALVDPYRVYSGSNLTLLNCGQVGASPRKVDPVTV